MGRRRKPLKEKKLLGFPGKRGAKKPVVVAAPKPEVIAKPTWMPPGAAKLWDRLAPKVSNLKAEHVEQFADYCVCLHRLQQQEKLVEREGVITKGAKGKRKNPRLQVIREYRQAAQKWAAAFGLTPGAGSGDGDAPPPGAAGDDVLNGNWR